MSAPADPPPASADLGPCLEVLREADRDRYLSVLYLPTDLRVAAAAIHAFDAEISRVPALVSGPAPGEFRLQWWREVVDGRREPGNHPVAASLLAAITRYGLPRPAFVACLDAHVFDLYQDAMPDRQTLEGYCGETCSALLRMVALAAADGKDDAPGGEASLADACGHAGVALAMTGLIRRAGYHRSRERCYVPAEFLAAAGLDREQWLFAPPDGRHLAALDAMFLLARDHLDRARGPVGRLPLPLRAVFLPLATVPAHLDAAARAGIALFASVPDIAPLRRHWLFWRAGRSAVPF